MTQNLSNELTQKFAAVNLFRDLPRESLPEIVSRCNIVNFKAGEQIIRHLDTTTELYFILQGQVRAIMYSMNGKQVTFQDLSSGAMFGELSAIDHEPRATYVTALTDTELGSMSAEVFMDLVRQHPGMATATMQRLCGLSRFLCDRVFQLSTLGVNNRIHAELLRLCKADLRNDNTGHIVPVPTHADVASRISTHREAVTRELNVLRENGLIDKVGNALVVKDVERLTEMVEEVLGY